MYKENITGLSSTLFYSSEIKHVQKIEFDLITTLTSL
jgi:hypothetical protein